MDFPLRHIKKLYFYFLHNRFKCNTTIISYNSVVTRQFVTQTFKSKTHRLSDNFVRLVCI